ncbi:hypothetical protein BDV98DRAFT_587105 [Pterulicium gracile]|uniref:Uncharacterized protein n=1 Tax=Pterulicium gracile TaxID=1884261 RepID=A0A5C3Q2M7_9AGAR|nr:hypothetical protein BDV98DRAFT_587105 [Pterula gracilis]
MQRLSSKTSWRALSLTNPNLWTIISLNVLRTRLRICLERARDCHLDISIAYGGDPMDTGVEELCMQWSRNSTGLFASELCLPNLETLVIAFTYEAMESHHILSLFNHAPALKQVTFYRPLEPEEHLGAYAFIPAKDKFDRLLLPTLCLVKQGAEIFPNILSNLQTRQILPDVRLPKLGRTFNQREYRQCAEELTAGPSLRSLDFGARVSTVPLRNLLRRSGARGVQSMNYEEVDCDNFGGALEDTPLLTHLCVRAISVGALKSVAETLTLKSPKFAFDSRCFELLKPEDFSLPHLKSLILYGVESESDSEYPEDWYVTEREARYNAHELDREHMSNKYGQTLSSLLHCENDGPIKPWPLEDRITVARITVENNCAWENVYSGESLWFFRELAAKAPGLNVDIEQRGCLCVGGATDARDSFRLVSASSQLPQFSRKQTAKKFIFESSKDDHIQGLAPCGAINSPDTSGVLKTGSEGSDVGDSKSNAWVTRLTSVSHIAPGGLSDWESGVLLRGIGEDMELWVRAVIVQMTFYAYGKLVPAH